MNSFETAGKLIVLLLLTSLFILSSAFAADAGPEISDVQAKIQKTESDIKFEKSWNKKLEKANKSLKALQLATSDFGPLLMSLGSIVNKEWSEDELRRKIDKANRMLEPFFKIDEKGNLQWGSALQMIGIQSQFAPAGGMTVLTPGGAETVMSEWQQKNLAKLAQNEKELEKLNKELKRLEAYEARKQDKSQRLFGDSQGQLTALIKELNKEVDTIRGFERLKKQYDNDELEMKLHLAAIEKAENEAKRVNGIVSKINTTIYRAFGRLNEGPSPMERLKEKIDKLNKEYKMYAKTAMAATRAAKQVCDYAARTSNNPPPSADKIKDWGKKSDRAITETAGYMRGHDNEIRSLITVMDPEITRLREDIVELEDFNRNVLPLLVEQLKEIKDKLDNAEKTHPRVKELRAALENNWAFANEKVPGLKDPVKKIRLKAIALAEKVKGGDGKLEVDIKQFHSQVDAAFRRAQKVIDDHDRIDYFEISKVPELSPEFKRMRAKLKDADNFTADRRIKDIDSTIADRRKAISDAEGAVVAGAFATKNAPGDLKRARECYASLQGSLARGIVVPKVTEEGVVKGIEIIKLAGFELTPDIEVGKETGDSSKDGFIYRQDPAPGTLYEPRKKVKLWVYNYVSAKTKVPKVTEEDVVKGAKIIELAGFHPAIEVGKETADSSKDGFIYRQDPAPGTLYEPLKDVKLWVYNYVANKNTVPKVTGKEVGAAADAVKLAGFHPAFIVGKATNDRNNDLIIYEQYPKPGASIEPGSDIKLWIWNYVMGKTAVPSLTGMSLAAATSKLKAKGLFVNVNKVKNVPAGSTPGVVYKQYPKPGFEVLDGIGIDVWVYGEHAPVQNQKCDRYYSTLNQLMQKEQNQSMKMVQNSGQQVTYACDLLKTHKKTIAIASKARSVGCRIDGNFEESSRLLAQTARQLCKDAQVTSVKMRRYTGTCPLPGGNISLIEGPKARDFVSGYIVKCVYGVDCNRNGGCIFKVKVSARYGEDHMLRDHLSYNKGQCRYDAVCSKTKDVVSHYSEAFTTAHPDGGTFNGKNDRRRPFWLGVARDLLLKVEPYAGPQLP